MAAQIFTAEQAEQFARWTKFMPRGARAVSTTAGSTPTSAAFRPPSSEEGQSRHVSSPSRSRRWQSVEECDAIAAIDGVDLLFIGPVDLSQSLGVTGEFFHPKCIEAIDRVAAACAKHGKHWGAVTANLEHCDLLVGKGCRLITPTNDVRLINAAACTAFGRSSQSTSPTARSAVAASVAGRRTWLAASSAPATLVHPPGLAWRSSRRISPSTTGFRRGGPRRLDG